MANPHRGEVEIGADGEVWTLRYTSNAVARIEAKFDLPWGKIIERLVSPDARMADLIRFFWGGLWHHHRDLKEDDAGDIMDCVGQPVAVKSMFEALSLAFPAPKEGAKAGPRKARD